VLPPGATLHVWTDVEEYFTESMDFAAATGLFGPPREESSPDATHDLDYRTHFERRTRLAGQPVWRAALDRNEVPAGCEREPLPSLPAS
jgi:tRNA (guanine-N7-)-methyltransferase